MRKYRHFIFDLDGTLFRVNVDWKLVRKELSSIGISLSEKIFLFPQLEKIKDRLVLEKAFAIIDRHETEAVKNSEELENSTELLKKLSKIAGLSLVTMQGIKFCTMLLSSRNILDIFRSVITREFSLSRRKQLEQAIKISGETKDKILFIGDRETDVVAANEIELDVAVVWTYRGIAPTYRLEKLEEVLNFAEVK